MTLEEKKSLCEVQKNNKMIFVGTPDTEARIKEVQSHLLDSLGEIPIFIQQLEKFADGSWKVEIEESVGGKHVFVYADYFSDYLADEMRIDINSRYVLFDHICDAIIRNRAKTLNIISPKFPYARSDKNEDMGMHNKPKRTPLYAKRVADHMLHNKVANCISIDLHNASIVGFFDGRDSRAVNLGYGRIVKKAIEMAQDQQNNELGSTDLGGAKKVDRMASDLGINSFVGDKSRDRTIPNSVASLKVHKGNAKIAGHDVKVYDDMLDTGGTIEKLTQELNNDKPASTDIIVTHYLENGKARKILDALHAKGIIRNVYTTDSVYRTMADPEYVKRISTAPIIAKTIESLVNGESIDYNYIGE